MGRARILMDAGVGKWSVVKAGSGMERAKKLAKLTGAVIQVVSGKEAFSREERGAFRVLSTEQVESGNFEVCVLEWEDKTNGKGGKGEWQKRRARAN